MHICVCVCVCVYVRVCARVCACARARASMRVRFLNACVYFSTHRNKNTYTCGDVADAPRVSTTESSAQSEGVGWSYLETKWIGLEIQISICLPLSIRARRHTPPLEAKSYRVYIRLLSTEGKRMDLCLGWTQSERTFVVG